MRMSLLSSFLVLLFCGANTVAQSKDPFGERDPFQSDPLNPNPFSNPTASKQRGKRFEICYKFFGPDGNPVAFKKIKGALRTLAVVDGVATERVDERLIHAKIPKSSKKAIFQFVAPEEALLAPVRLNILPADLLQTKTIEVHFEEGVRLMGQVLGKRDGLPVANATVRAVAVPESENVTRNATTDANGNWTQVVPKGEIRLEVGGNVPGYFLRNGVFGSKYTRFLNAENAEEELAVEPFRVKQLDPVQVFVVDELGNPQANMTVTVKQRMIVDDLFMFWRSFSRLVKTDEHGRCTIFPMSKTEEKLKFFASDRSSSGFKSAGFTLISGSELKDQVTIQVYEPVKIRGVLCYEGVPIENQILDLVEVERRPDGGIGSTLPLASNCVTDSNGRYAFKAVRGAEYLLLTPKEPIEPIQDRRESSRQRLERLRSEQNRVLLETGPLEKSEIEFPVLDLKIEEVVKRQASASN